MEEGGTEDLSAWRRDADPGIVQAAPGPHWTIFQEKGITGHLCLILPALFPADAAPASPASCLSEDHGVFI